ncbi:T9SS type A sorting domain-containing protein [Fluviicola sp.]|uniref:T9SS type A sorting domain-containing protein n=1 Tax=Fluviicola sp. TaxID=1917219 RepID=UPI002622B912|nr:T9SS type A sorting domain-containing protein [Fluviicola sp.]
MNVLQHGNTSWAWNERSLTGRIDNDCLSNLSFSGGTISANEKVACGNLPNQITSTAAASVPNSYYSMTSYQWQSSTDGTNWTNITSATGLNYSPPALYTTTYYRRIAFGPCGISLSSNTITKLVLLNVALNSEFTVSANCLSGQSTFTVNAIPNVNSGINFTGTWTITDLTTSGAPYTNPAWNNCGPCTFPGYTFTQGHTYQIVYTVQDRCTTQGSSTHTVTCVAGIAQQDGVTSRTTLSNSIIHPNPTNGVFTVDLKEMSASGISVYNTQGRLIRSVAIAKNTSTSGFDLSDQPNGMYLIELHTENGFITHKLIKE